MTYAITRHRAGLAVPQPRENTSVRRIFNNDQLIERFDSWLQVTGKRPKTRLSYISAVKQFAKILDKPLTAADQHDIRAFLSHLYARNLGSGTRAARLFGLRSFYDFLQLGEQIKFSVPRSVSTTKVSKRLPHAKSEEEIERLIAAAETPRDIALLELGYASALRVSELRNLRVEDLNLTSRTLIVREGKGGDDRMAYFGRKAARAITKYLDGRTTGFLFQPLPFRRKLGILAGGVWRDKWGVWRGAWRERCADGKRVMHTVRLGDYELPTRRRAREALSDFLDHKAFTSKAPKDTFMEGETPDRRLDTRQLYRIIAEAAKRAGIEGVHPHILRHSCATHCLNRGMDIRFVQELLGHKSIMATQKYLHVATAALERTHAQFHPHGGRPNAKT